jgi:two-component system phosphate regulon sensor histidine kinase PhoR
MRWRMRPLLVVFTLCTLLLAFAAVYMSTTLTLRRALHGRLDRAAAEAIVDGFDGTLLLVSVALLAIAAIAAGVLGGRLGRTLVRMRAEVAAHARGELPPHSEPSRIAELAGLGDTIERAALDAREAASELTAQRDELATLVSVVSEGILHIDAEGRILHLNPAAATLLGIPGHAAGQLLAGFVRHAELRLWLDRVRAGDAVATEITIDGRRLLFSAVPAHAAQERPGDRAALVISCVDLTELRRLEGVRRDFVANVSHELKTPLTSIRGYAETLLGDDLSPELQKPFLEVILDNARRLQSIVDDLLDLSRLEAGAWTPRLAGIDPLEVASGLRDNFADRAARRQVEIVITGERLTVRADADALRHVLSNLYDNALRHSRAGGRITVRVTAAPASAAHRSRRAPAPAWVALEVEDDGSGIPSDALPRIFERFFRVDPSRSRDDGGTGLGLAIVKHMVESMGGTVTARSELGKGTTIRVLLPAA